MSQNNNGLSRLMDACADASAALTEKRRLEKELRQQNARYAAALAHAQSFGVMPLELQQAVGIDALTRQVAVKIVALRELEKIVGKQGHPLLNQSVRTNVATEAVINYYRANPQVEVELAQFAPADEVVQRIFAACPDNRNVCIP